ncbi:hypothetical protein EGW08_022977, partial [Elysia chlorotica]
KRGARCNLLVEFIGQIFHQYRFSCLVSDLSGCITRLIVHDPKGMYSHPSLVPGESGISTLQACLRPGDFLLLLAVHWRQFTDGLPGIRINSLDSIYVINMADRKMPRNYRQRLEGIAQEESTKLRLQWNFGLMTMGVGGGPCPQMLPALSERGSQDDH